MPWREGSGDLSLAIDAAQNETDFGTDHEQPRIAVPVHRNGSRAFGALVLGYVDVTLPHDCWRIGPGNEELREWPVVLRSDNYPAGLW